MFRKFIKEEIATQAFSCEFCKIFKITYFVELLRKAASNWKASFSIKWLESGIERTIRLALLKKTILRIIAPKYKYLMTLFTSLATCVDAGKFFYILHSWFFWRNYYKIEFNFERFRKRLSLKWLPFVWNHPSEAASRGVLLQKVFLEISQSSQENTCARVSFLIKLQAWGLQLY